MSVIVLKELWQPRGGNIRFTINQQTALPAETIFRVCFRWRTTSHSTKFVESPLVRLDSIGADGVHALSADVPNLANAPPRFFAGVSTNAGEYGEYVGLGLVPVADMRVIALSNNQMVADDVTPIGVTMVGLGAVLATLGALALIGVLAAIKIPGLRVRNPLLRIITTAGGYASLSQFQVLLWTAVVGASAIYVMALSGTLITISDGTLVLLGISGGTTLASKLQSAAAGASNTPANNPLAPAKPTAPASHTPAWSDLVLSDGQIDIARVQMLFFTLISASFVVMKVIVSYTIPDIPSSIQILMGLSNGVYLGAKIAGSPAAPPPATPSPNNGLVGPAPVAGHPIPGGP